MCSVREAGSREHLPGVAATNDGPVEITYLSRARDGSGNAQPVTRTEADGLVVRTLCRRCNSRTGGNFGTAYKDFVKQFAASGRLFDNTAPRCWISLTNIQPLRIAKQMISMFMAAQAETSPGYWQDLRRFVLNKDARLPSESLKIYLYRNTASIGRIVPFTGMMSVYRRWPQMMLSEIAWPPLGIVFAMESHPLLEGMYDMSRWGKDFHFRSQVSLQFSVPQLSVSTHWPLGFGSSRQAHQWAEDHGVVLLLHGGSEGGDVPPFPAVTRTTPRRPA